MAIRKEFITSVHRDRCADRGLRVCCIRWWSPASARSPSPATPTARRSTSAASSSARRSSARTSRCRSTRTASRRCPTASRSPRPTRVTSRRGPRGRRRLTTPPLPSFANYGPNSKITEKAIAGNIAAYIQLNGKYYPGGLTAAKVPVDAADTSASGIDPDISVANARIQAYRIAAVRHLPLGDGRRPDLQVHGRARARLLR